MTAVTKSPRSIRFIKKQNPYAVRTAVRADGGALRYVKDTTMLTDDDLIVAMKKDVVYFDKITNPSQAVIKATIEAYKEQYKKKVLDYWWSTKGSPRYWQRAIEVYMTKRDIKNLRARDRRVMAR